MRTPVFIGRLWCSLFCHWPSMEDCHVDGLISASKGITLTARNFVALSWFLTMTPWRDPDARHAMVWITALKTAQLAKHVWALERSWDIASLARLGKHEILYYSIYFENLKTCFPDNFAEYWSAMTWTLQDLFTYRLRHGTPVARTAEIILPVYWFYPGCICCGLDTWCTHRDSLSNPVVPKILMLVTQNDRFPPSSAPSKETSICHQNSKLVSHRLIESSLQAVMLTQNIRQ